MLKLIIAVTFLFCICSCGKVKNESVRVIQTDSFSGAFVIQVDKVGTYYVYITNESDRYQYAQLLNQKATIGDSIWKVKLSDIDKCIAIYKKATKDKNISMSPLFKVDSKLFF